MMVSTTLGEIKEEEEIPPDEFKCPLTLEVMEDPVTLFTETGRCFERSELERWLARYPKRDPISNIEHCEPLRFAPNRPLKSAIDRWRSAGHSRHLEALPEKTPPEPIDESRVPVDAPVLDDETTELKLDGVKDVGRLASTLGTRETALTSLSLEGNDVGDEGVSVLAACLGKSKITSLDLRGNRVGDVGAARIAANLGNLTNLNLSLNNIGDRGARVISAALGTNCALQTLGLMWNNIGDEGAIHLKVALETNHTLSTLRLGFNRIGPALRADLRKLRRLKIYT
ncbi:hypothetical protein CTAYLR_004474 [Chrysophaeum taylorii]|uniref:U-box domain-containing protein n=1 Tax=Chrysophaeum taylorii TaxID=2483200 RepID=A0AAD7UNY9_9STRA|nr:hypothetical protein CTAYLR_004422 [Chrysophaeum taylorii]KAJ8613633.1 hypothetical protein CTAYLR_004474 [Chrysophaeum taylorii]